MGQELSTQISDVTTRMSGPRLENEPQRQPAMSVDLNKRIDMTCPVCEKSFHQALGWLVKHSEVICPHCDSSYKVSISDLETIGAESLGAAAGSSFFTKIAGVTHRNNDRKSRQRLIAQCRVGEELVLERESDSPVDTNAIKVLRLTGEHLGYIPAHVAASGLAKDLDRGEQPKCRIVNLTGGDGLTRGVNIEIGEWPEDSHPSRAAIPNESAAPFGWIVFIMAIVAVAVLLVLLRSQ
jgi:uncharacterized Zn-finger protein